MTGTEGMLPEHVADIEPEPNPEPPAERQAERWALLAEMREPLHHQGGQPPRGGRFPHLPHPRRRDER